MSDPRVIGLAGYGLEVPDLDVADRFYTAFGLEGGRRGDMSAFRSPGRPQDEVVLVKGAQKRMHHVSFLIKPKDLAAFGDKLKQAGMDVKESLANGHRAGLWFQDPWGTWVNLTPGEAPPPAPPAKSAERLDQHFWATLERDPKPKRIGHMLVYSGEWEKTEKFYADVLGLRTSDKAAGKVAFMCAGEGVIDHHCFGVVNGTHPGYQHASFQMTSIDDIGFGAWRMNKAGFKEGFGPGRHALASNLFHYTRDPWGSWIEYYADMDKITAETWQTREWNELPYIWGPEWSGEFWGKQMNGNFEPK